MATKNLGIDPEKEEAAISEINRGKARMDALEHEQMRDATLGAVSAGLKVPSIMPRNNAPDFSGVDVNGAISRGKARREYAVMAGEKAAAENIDTAPASIDGEISQIRKSASDEVDGWFADPTKGELDEIRQKYGKKPAVATVQPPDTQQVADTQPAAQQPPKHTIGNDGKSRTAYGGKVRVVDQTTGAVSWEDLKGNATSAPDSESTRSALGANTGNIDPWKAAVEQQNQAKMENAMRIAQAKVDANNAELSTRRRRIVKQNLKVADNIQQATANMQRNLADVQSFIANGGDIAESGAHKDKDGNWYVSGIVAPTQVKTFNEEMAKLGGKDALDKIVVSLRVDQYGTPIKDAEPTFGAVYIKDGNIGGKGARYPKHLTLREAMRYVAKAYEDDGNDHDAAVNYAAGVFGVDDPEKFGLSYKSRDSKERVERMRQDGLNHRAGMRQGQFDQKMELQRQQLDEQVQKRLSAAKSAEERANILKEAKAAELKLRQDEIESRYAQMGVQYGTGETRKAAQSKIGGKLTSDPSDKATTKSGDNGEDDNAPSVEYPGYTKGKARRAIAAGWKWDPEKNVFVKP